MTGAEDPRTAFLRKVNVSRETLDRLDTYASLLAKWNPAINLVAPSTLPQVWVRHFLDSSQLVNLAPEHTKSWVDLGSGGGFPGLIVATLAADSHPELKVTCVESDVRKATFLRSVVRETGIEAEVISKRLETLPPLGADVVSARALAPLPMLLGQALHHLSRDGRALLLKGAGYRRELEEALEKWTFDVDTVTSATDPEAVILSIGEIRRV